MSAPESEASQVPDRASLVLVALILVAAVANLNLAVANVALPSIGLAFDASQVELNLVAVGYSLGLAASVLYFGALGDRYGRKMMLILGTALAVPFSLLAAYAPSDGVLFLARVGGGLSAGMAFPTTLALITALWSGPGRTHSIALWSALGGAISALGPLLSGLEHMRNDFVSLDRPDPLTDRETEILRLMASGFSNKEIANSLGVAEGTIKNHVSNILSKLGVRDRTRAVLKAFELQLV